MKLSLEVVPFSHNFLFLIGAVNRLWEGHFFIAYLHRHWISTTAYLWVADSLKFLTDLQICSRIWPFKYGKIICFNKVLLKQQSLYIEDSTTYDNWTWREELKYGLRKTLCLFLNVGKQNSDNWSVSWRWIILCFGIFNVFKTKISRLFFEVILVIQALQLGDFLAMG